MEIAALTAFLAPFLPYLVHLGQAAADAAGSALGQDAWNVATRLWRRLRPAVETRPEAKAAVMTRAAGVDDPAAMNDLRTQLDQLVQSNAELRAELEQIWTEATASNVVSAERIQAIGERSIALGTVGDGAIISTGDNMSVSREKDE